jgi:hypothetical protein
MGAIDCLLLVPMKLEWGTEWPLNGLSAPEDLSAGGMEALLVD